MTPENVFIAWLHNVNALLDSQHGLQVEDIYQADWHFDFYLSWVAGIRPGEAVEDAITEMIARGIYDEARENRAELARLESEAK